MSIEVWIALAAIIIPTSFALIALWVKTKSEIEVIKKEVSTLRSMVEKQIQVDETIAISLMDIKLALVRLETKAEA